MFDRNLLVFEDFQEQSYNADFDCYNAYGVNVYYNDIYIGNIYWKTSSQLNNIIDSKKLKRILKRNKITI